MAENPRAERRLAAILAADVAGYSRLMGADEEGTLERLKALRRELVDPKVAEHQGRIVKVTGDGMLVAFSSVVDAVRCAVAVQQAMPERNAGVSEAQCIEFRISVNLGDVIVDGDDLYGDESCCSRLTTIRRISTLLVRISASSWQSAMGGCSKPGCCA
jgi:adenylate cyclase